MTRLVQLFGAAICLAGMMGTLSGCGGSTAGERPSVELLNVSYDPTRELWRDINTQFVKRLKAESGIEVSIKQSRAGSSSQARAVIDGLGVTGSHRRSQFDFDVQFAGGGPM